MSFLYTTEFQRYLGKDCTFQRKLHSDGKLWSATMVMEYLESKGLCTVERKGLLAKAYFPGGIPTQSEVNKLLKP